MPPHSSDKKPAKPLRRVLLWALPVAGLLLAYQVLTGPRGVLKISDLRAEKHKILREIDSLETRKSELLDEKRRLLGDTAYLEKLARKELGMAKPGEMVYRFVAPAQPASPAAASAASVKPRPAAGAVRPD
jgi:cell division protein FtsB